MYKDDVIRVAVRVSKENPGERIYVYEDHCCWDWCYEQDYLKGEIIAIIKNGEDVSN